jgi:hypothetical protein
MDKLNQELDSEINSIITINQNFNKNVKITFHNIIKILKIKNDINPFKIIKNNLLHHHFFISNDLCDFFQLDLNKKYTYHQIYILFFQYLNKMNIDYTYQKILYNEKIEDLFNIKKNINILNFDNLNIYLEKHFIKQ